MDSSLNISSSPLKRADAFDFLEGPSSVSQLESTQRKVNSVKTETIPTKQEARIRLDIGYFVGDVLDELDPSVEKIPPIVRSTLSKEELLEEKALLEEDIAMYEDQARELDEEYKMCAKTEANQHASFEKYRKNNYTLIASILDAKDRLAEIELKLNDASKPKVGEEFLTLHKNKLMREKKKLEEVLQRSQADFSLPEIRDHIQEIEETLESFSTDNYEEDPIVEMVEEEGVIWDKREQGVHLALRWTQSDGSKRIDPIKYDDQ